MTTRTSSPSAHPEVWKGLRRWLALHRRWVSATLAFVAVLVGLTSLAQPAEPERSPRVAAPTSAALLDGHLAVPLRLSDPAVAALLGPGDVVDVMVADQRSTARLVAADLTVTAVPDAGSGGPWAQSDGLVMVAATEDQALSLAGAAAHGPVTVAVHP
jgi:pilus assembly protein CpaB